MSRISDYFYHQTSTGGSHITYEPRGHFIFTSQSQSQAHEDGIGESQQVLIAYTQNTKLELGEVEVEAGGDLWRKEGKKRKKGATNRTTEGSEEQK